MQVLNTFSIASGTTLNKAKSNVFFFNTLVISQHNIVKIVGFQQGSLPSKNLGAPLIDSSKQVASWEYLVLRLEWRLSSWTFRTLNFANRATLVKSVLQSMSLYILSALAPPKYILNKMWNIQRNFLWGGSKNPSKWTLIGWDTLCLPKNKGGLGFRDPETLSSTLGAKIWWNWIKHSGKPWAQLWKAKYATNWNNSELIRMEGKI